MHHVAIGIVGGFKIESKAKQLVQVGKAVAANDPEGIPFELLHRSAVVGHHLLQLAQDQFQDGLQIQSSAYGLRSGLQGLCFATALSLGGEQLGVVDGNDYLIGDGFCQFDLIRGKDAGRVNGIQSNRANDLSLEDKWDDEDRLDVAHLDYVPDC